MEALLENKTKEEKVLIKSDEIIKTKFKGDYQDGDYKVKVHKVEKIDGGIQIYAQAWQGDKQFGFGEFGHIDIERFKIYNPPVLIDNPNGEIIREWRDEISNEIKQRKLSWNPIESIKQSLLHTIQLSGKLNTQIIKGEIGKTVATFYPDADPESTSVDGYARGGSNGSTSLSFSALRAEAGDVANDSGTNTACGRLKSSTTTDEFSEMNRSFFLYDTSAIENNAKIKSGILSLYGQVKYNQLGDIGTSLVSSNPASNVALVASDFPNIGSTEFSTTITYANWSTTAYNDFSLNSSGLANISKTGISKFGTRSDWDLNNSFGGSWGSELLSATQCWTADQTGTAQDPKLVVTYLRGFLTLPLLGVG
jgi:hypothetical protein